MRHTAVLLLQVVHKELFKNHYSIARILISRIAERPENSRVKGKLHFRCKQGEAKAKIGRTGNVFEITVFGTADSHTRIKNGGRSGLRG